MEAKIHICADQLEVDCEGSEDFLRQEFTKLLDAIVKLRESSNVSSGAVPAAKIEKDGKPSTGSLTTKTVAAKLKCKTGPDLVLASAAKLSIADQQDSFSRNDVIKEMKSATGFFKASYIGNLTKSISTLIKDGKLNETSADTYALPENVKAELEVQLD